MTSVEPHSAEASDPQSDVSAAYKSALRSLSAREMSGFEVERTLRRKGRAASVAREVVERLRSEGWVDDLRFACAYLRYRIRSKPAAIVHLRAELAKRGCDRETVGAAIDIVSEDGALDDLALARALVAGRHGSEARKPERLLRLLARRGFSLEVARRVVGESGAGLEFEVGEELPSETDSAEHPPEEDG